MMRTFWLLDKCVAGGLSKLEQLFYQANTPMLLLGYSDARKLWLAAKQNKDVSPHNYCLDRLLTAAVPRMGCNMHMVLINALIVPFQ